MNFCLDASPPVHPEISNDFYSDQAQAIATRREMFRRVVGENLLIGGAIICLSPVLAIW